MFFKWCYVEATITDKQEQHPWFSARLIRNEQVEHICYFSQCTARVCLCVYSIYTCSSFYLSLQTSNQQQHQSATSSESTMATAADQHPAQSFLSSHSHFKRETALWREFITGAQHLSEMIVASNWGSDWRRPRAPMSVMQRCSDWKDGKG